MLRVIYSSAPGFGPCFFLCGARLPLYTKEVWSFYGVCFYRISYKIFLTLLRRKQYYRMCRFYPSNLYNGRVDKLAHAVYWRGTMLSRAVLLLHGGFFYNKMRGRFPRTIYYVLSLAQTLFHIPSTPSKNPPLVVPYTTNPIGKVKP